MKNLITLITILIAFNSFTQSFETTIDAPLFVSPCMDTNSMIGFRTEELNGENFLLSRMSEVYNSCTVMGGTGYAISKISESGDTIYTKLFMHPDLMIDSTGIFNPKDFTIGSDSSIYVVGEEITWDSPSDSIFIAKHNINGELIWKKNYSGLIPEVIYADGSTIFVGGKNHLGNQLYSINLIQLDSSGTIEHEGSFESGSSPRLYDIVKRNSDLVIIGRQAEPGSMSSNYRPFIIPFSHDYIDPLSLFYFGNSTHDYPEVDAIYGVNQTLLLAGYSQSYQSTHLFEINEFNQQISGQVFELNYQMERYRMIGIAQNQNSDIIIVGERGYVNDFNSGYGQTISYEKFDLSGMKISETEFAGTPYDVTSNNQNEVIIAGTRYNKNILDLNMRNSLLLKLDEEGLTGECSPHFVLNYLSSYQTDSLVTGGVINVINNGEGDAENFHWELNGETSWYFGHNISIQLYQSGWNTLELVGCGQTFKDSVYIKPITTDIIEISDITTDIYPNPFNEKLTINGFSGVYELYDLQGRIINKMEVKDGVVLDMSNIKKGVYNVVLRNDEVRFTKLLVKN